MFGNSAMNRLRSLDVYRKIPKDYTESTLSGAASTLFLDFNMNLLNSFDNKWGNNDNTFRKRAK